MSKQNIINYVFSATNKTVTLPDFGVVQLDRLLLIVNATRNLIYYNFADSTVGTATVAGNIITFTASVGTGVDTDKIFVLYDNLPGDPKYGASGQRIYDENLCTEDRAVRQEIELLRMTVVSLIALVGGFSPNEALEFTTHK